jgi:hypothetical protein
MVRECGAYDVASIGADSGFVIGGKQNFANDRGTENAAKTLRALYFRRHFIPCAETLSLRRRRDLPP